MARYKTYDYDQLTMIPVSLRDQLEPGTLEYTIHYVVEERLDLSSFDLQYCNDEQGRPAYDPRILLNVILLGYSRAKLSSRKLEAACKENIIFIAMTCGQTPDHSTIAEFVSGMGEERISELFAQVLMVCEEEGLLSGTHFSMDGYKLSTNASKEWSGTHADLNKKKETLQKLIAESVKEHKRNDRANVETPEALIKRKERLIKNATKIERFLAENPAASFNNPLHPTPTRVTPPAVASLLGRSRAMATRAMVIWTARPSLRSRFPMRATLRIRDIGSRA